MTAVTPSIKLLPGLLNLSGATAVTRRTVEKLLTEDFRKNHCYFRTEGLHNHLNHHVLAAYDLGGSAELMEAINTMEDVYQRDIALNVGGKNVLEKERKVSVDVGGINEGNWKKFFGDQTAYGAYVTFFTERALKDGVLKTIEKFIFSPEANDDGTDMVIRLMAGALHPFIQLGYALEFGSDPHLVAAALAQTAIHEQGLGQAECYDYPKVTSPDKKKTSSLFQIIKEINTNEILKPLPYNPNGYFGPVRDAHFGPGTKRSAELAYVCSLWEIDPDKMEEVVEQVILAATLVLTAVGREGKKPRLDFFLMHATTSAIFFPTYFKVITNPEHRVRLVRYWWTTIAILLILRGRPNIDGKLAMGFTDTPFPRTFANSIPSASKRVIGTNPINTVNPWMVIVNSALRTPDAHTTKTIRTLLYAAQKYAERDVGEFPGILDENGNEVLPGLELIDGTVFVRAAGVTMNVLGWVDWGEEAGDWDRGGLGWDEAWEKEPDHRVLV